jgi:stage IV sporulation protein FA
MNDGGTGMDTKHNVKQRRLERLKRLQEPGAPGSAAGFRESAAGPGETRPPDIGGVPDMHPAAVVPETSSRWDDPEYAWNHRFSRDKSVYGGGGGPQADEPRLQFGPPVRRGFWVRLGLCGLLFSGIWGMFRLPHPLAQLGKQYVTAALTEPMNMEALAAWYETHFRGMPSILPSFLREGEESMKVSSYGNRTYFAPAKGAIESPFSAGKQGVLIKTQEDAPVYAMDTGLVTFAGVREGTGFTVEIQHPNGLKTVYGEVAECKLEVNDWIKGGEAIGKASKQTDGGELYFAVQKEGRYVNPAEVVSIVK